MKTDCYTCQLRTPETLVLWWFWFSVVDGGTFLWSAVVQLGVWAVYEGTSNVRSATNMYWHSLYPPVFVFLKWNNQLRHILFNILHIALFFLASKYDWRNRRVIDSLFPMHWPCFQMLQAYSASVHSCHPMENTVHCTSSDLMPNPIETQWQNTPLAVYSNTYWTVNNCLIDSYLFTAVVFVSS